MSVTSQQAVQLEGFPEARVEPLSPEGVFRWVGTATGDASGGTVNIQLQVTERENTRFLFVPDVLNAESGTGETNDGLITWLGWQGDTLSGRSHDQVLVGNFNSAHGRRYTRQEQEPPKLILGDRLRANSPRTLVTMSWETNVNTLGYTFLVSGRYYRRSEVRDPAFFEKVFR